MTFLDDPRVAIARLREVAALVAELADGGGEAGRWLINLVAKCSSAHAWSCGSMSLRD